MIVAVVNKSTLVSNADAETMTRVVASQVRYHFAVTWQRVSPSVIFYANEAQVPTGTAKIALLDDSDTPGAAGWHSGESGVPFGRVFARPVLAAGGDALHKDPSVSSILSHEILELLGDPPVNLWASDLGMHGGPREYAYEACDPVEADSYTHRTSSAAGTPISARVSNFVLPAWFDPSSPGPYDYMKKLTAPFAMTPHGYLIYRDEAGAAHTVFGALYPEWRKATKVGASRTARRRVAPVAAVAAQPHSSGDEF